MHKVLADLLFGFDADPAVRNVLGVAGNVLAMAVLFRAKKMTSVFNRLLTCLLVIHTLYILNSLTLQVIYEF